MIPPAFKQALTLVVSGVFALSPGLASAQGQSSSQGQSGQSQSQQQSQTQQQTQNSSQQSTGQNPQQQPATQDPSQQPPIGQTPATSSPPPTPASQPAPQQTQQPAADQPIQQKDTVTPKNSKEDVDAIGNRGVGKGVNFYSLEREIALGKQLAQEVERSSKLIDDPVVVEYVNRVGQNLVRNSDARVPFTIKVIDSDVVNAFALPGGFFYVNSGLILRAQEEAELAGVMAHEIRT